MSECYWYDSIHVEKPKTPKKKLLSGNFPDELSESFTQIQNMLVGSNINYMQSFYDKFTVIVNSYKKSQTLLGKMEAWFSPTLSPEEYADIIQKKRGIVSNYLNVHSDVIQLLAQHGSDVEHHITSIDYYLTHEHNAYEVCYQLELLKERLYQHSDEVNTFKAEVVKVKTEIQSMLDIE